MYEKYYGFKEKPFQIVPNPDYLYFSKKHETALAYLEYGVREGVGFILLTGEIGTGKTTLIRYILKDIEDAIEVAVVFNTNVNNNQLLCLILKEFDIEPGDDKTSNLELLYNFLIEKYAQRKRVLLIIDEAQNLTDDVLEEVRMLSNLQSDNSLLLHIMLVGQPELKEKLRQRSLSQLTQRIAVSYHLVALNRNETGQYIKSRLQIAGGAADLFTENAIEEINRFTKGVPRSINVLCDIALVYGFAEESKCIDSKVIEQVIKENDIYGFEAKGASFAVEEGSILPEVVQSRVDSSQALSLFADIEKLKTEVMQLKIQMTYQFEELERRTDGFKDNLILELREQVGIERGKNKSLLLYIGELKGKYKKLQSQVDEIKLSENVPQENIENRKTLRRKLFG